MDQALQSGTSVLLFFIFDQNIFSQLADKGEEEYVKRWVNEYPDQYMPPMVNHEFARKRALETYKNAFKPK